MRKRSANTSKSMLPCGRGASLSKSAGFKNIPEDVQIKHNNDTKIDHKTVDRFIRNQFQKWCGKLLKYIIINTRTLWIADPILDQCAWSFCAGECFWGDLFLGTSARHPWDRFGPPLGHLWSDFAFPQGTLGAVFLLFLCIQEQACSGYHAAKFLKNQ